MAKAAAVSTTTSRRPAVLCILDGWGWRSEMQDNAIAAAWMVPFALKHGWPITQHTWMGDTAMRFRDWKLEDVLNHLWLFPVELIGCTFPWSVLWLVYLKKDVRTSLGERAHAVLFIEK